MTTTLADACSAHRGATFPASKARYEPQENYVACLTTSAVQDEIDWATKRFVPRKALGRAWTRLVAGDILVSTANSFALIGKSALVRDVDGDCAFGAFVTLLRPRNGVDARYISYFLRSPDVREKMSSFSSQTTNISNLRVSDLLSLELSLPSFAEQRRIADRMDAAMMEVSAARGLIARQRENSERLYFAVIEEAMGGRTIATDNANDQDGEGWQPLTRVARLESGHTPSRRRPEWWGGDIPWLALPDIRAVDRGIIGVTRETTNALGIANSSARILPEGTVCLCRDASVGLVTILGRSMATSQHFVNWIPGQNLRPWYLAYALIGARAYLRGLSAGSVLQTIYMPILKGLHIRLPSLAEQDCIIERVSEGHSALADASKSIAAQAIALNSFPAAMLSAAFRGEL